MRDRPMVTFRSLKCKQSSSKGVRDDMWGGGGGGVGQKVVDLSLHP